MDVRTRPVKAWRKICRAGVILVSSILALAIWLLAMYSLNFV